MSKKKKKKMHKTDAKVESADAEVAESEEAVKTEEVSPEQIETLLSVLHLGANVTLIAPAKKAVTALQLVFSFHVQVVDADPDDPRETLLRIFRKK